MTENRQRSKVSNVRLNLAIAANGYKAMDPWVDSTGFRTVGLRHRNATLHREPNPAEEFLVSSRLSRHSRETSLSIEDYFSDESVTMLSLAGLEASTGIRQVSLPEGPDLGMSLGSAMASRRSVRSFTGDPLELARLASLLSACAGITAIATVQLLQGGEAELRFRSVPSGGGLYPIDLWIAALNVKGLDRGVYKYRPLDNSLTQIGDPTDMLRLMQGVDVPEELISLSQASALVIYVCHPWRSMRKYGNRGMRFMLMEVGAIAEHLNLAAVALGLGSTDFSAFYDDEINEALQLDGIHQAAIHMSIVGAPG